MSTRLIGLCGFAGAGKDTVANILNEHCGFARVGFADALREMLYELDPLVDRDMRRVSTIVDHGGWEYAKGLTEVRRLLQALGTEAGRKVLGEDVWIDAAFRKVDSVLISDLCDDEFHVHHNTAKGVVITDVRFENEATRISDEGGVLVYIHRGEPVNDHVSERLAEQMEAEYQHAYEGGGVGPLSFHHAIDNTGSLAVLHAKVHDLAVQLELTKKASVMEGGNQ